MNLNHQHTEENADDIILNVKNLKVYFTLPSIGFFKPKPQIVKAIDDVSFTLKAGETLGVVGESGCGKSTLGRGILNLIKPTSGQVIWMGSSHKTGSSHGIGSSDGMGSHEIGEDLTKLNNAQMRHYRKDMQIIFQDPLASLNPRMPIGEIIAEPLGIFAPHLSKLERQERVQEMLAKVGLLPQMLNRYPHEFSGGQCQRIGIARAMILKPKLIICDEPVSALDVSIQAQVITLLMELQQEFGLSLIFISHDLSVVRHLCHKIMVLYLGKIMELSDAAALYKAPLHPYTQALISAVPIPDPKLERAKKRVMLTGDLPSPINPPSGCVFRTRCPKAEDICAQKIPPLRNHEGRLVSCHLV